jgi:hypothetical protein
MGIVAAAEGIERKVIKIIVLFCQNKKKQLNFREIWKTGLLYPKADIP